MDYGRQIYNTLQDILQFLQAWKTSLDTWQTSLFEMLEKSLDLVFVVLCLVAVFVVCSVAMRLFFPSYRD